MLMLLHSRAAVCAHDDRLVYRPKRVQPMNQCLEQPIYFLVSKLATTKKAEPTVRECSYDGTSPTPLLIKRKRGPDPDGALFQTNIWVKVKSQFKFQN